MWRSSAVLLLVFPLLLVSLGNCSDTTEKDVVIRVIPTNLIQLKYLQSLQLQHVELDFWQEPTKLGRAVDIFLTKNQQENFFQSIQKYGLRHEVMIPDVERLISEEKRNERADWSDWTAYESIENIESFLLEKSQEYEFVDLIDFGDSYEGRNLWDLRINKPNPNGSQKNVFWLDANIHAREWITSAVATWIINELLTNSDLNDVIEQWDIHINPILNPDGLQYTKTEDRLWRKTRSPNSESSCIGADANRNWDYSFGGPGSSDNPCSNYYHGSRAFSEPETAAASEYISNLTQQPDMYLALHSFSQFVLTPWGDSYEHPEDYEDLMNIALRGEAEIERVGGGYWESGIVSELLHMGSGGARDWAKGIQGIKYAFTFELRDRGEYGFLLPAEQIIPAAQETLAGILAMLNAYLAAS